MRNFTPQFPKRFGCDRSAVAAVEFALVVPVMITLFLGGYDLFQYVVSTYKVDVIANSIAQMYSQTPQSTAATTSGDGVVSDWDVNFYWNSSYFLFPNFLSNPGVSKGNWSNYMIVSVASITMKPDGATYTPTIAWTANTGIQRACGTRLSAVPDTDAPSNSTLPEDIIGPNSIIAVDVHYTYVPMFGSEFLPSIPITQSVFMSPRNVTAIEYQGDGWMATNCPTS